MQMVVKDQYPTEIRNNTISIKEQATSSLYSIEQKISFLEPEMSLKLEQAR